ncbi:unnamed protein product [Dicrocoelium dendriticum]|nr:unnamed protein product [Dicrocoelium dendriticum]
MQNWCNVKLQVLQSKGDFISVGIWLIQKLTTMIPGITFATVCALAYLMFFSDAISKMTTRKNIKYESHITQAGGLHVSQFHDH